MKRRMFTVALIGPDGAGKTMLGKRLERDLPLPAKYVYMGVNADASNHLLPTTRLVRSAKRAIGIASAAGGPPQLVPEAFDGGSRRRRFLRSLKGWLRLANQLAEEWYRQLVAASYLYRGRIVLFDRHFFADYYAHDIVSRNGKPLSRRIHGFLLEHAYPRPDLVVYLDAPVEVLWERKPEGTPLALARRRREYVELASMLSNLEVVDASQPFDLVARDAASVICTHALRRRLPTALEA